MPLELAIELNLDLPMVRFNKNHDAKGKFASGDGGGDPNKWRNNTAPEEFIAARDKTTRPGFLSPLTPDALQGAKLYLSDDGKLGGVLRPDGDMENIFNNGAPKGAAADLLLKMVAEGGTTADGGYAAYW